MMTATGMNHDFPKNGINASTLTMTYGKVEILMTLIQSHLGVTCSMSSLHHGYRIKKWLAMRVSSLQGTSLWLERLSVRLRVFRRDSTSAT
jgi:hypothetical protein